MKLAPDAKKVFSGIIFDVYQWEQKMFDGSIETFEMLKRPDTVQVIATEGTDILLGIESQPTKGPSYTLFGGRVESGEDPLAAAKRELCEESGLESDDWHPLRSWTPYNKLDWTIYLYVARNCLKKGEPTLDPGEKIELKRVTFDEFIDIVAYGDFRGQELTIDVLRIYHDPEKKAIFQKQIFGN